MVDLIFWATGAIFWLTVALLAISHVLTNLADVLLSHYRMKRDLAAFVVWRRR